VLLLGADVKSYQLDALADEVVAEEFQRIVLGPAIKHHAAGRLLQDGLPDLRQNWFQLCQAQILIGRRNSSTGMPVLVLQGGEENAEVAVIPGGKAQVVVVGRPLGFAFQNSMIFRIAAGEQAKRVERAGKGV